MDKQAASITNQIDTSLDAVESRTLGSNSHVGYLSPKETRGIITPYAFFVADDLLGTPLAGPFRRGFGLLIDLFFITLLTQISSLVLASVAAWTFFKAGNRLNTKKRFKAVRIFLRLQVAMLLFFVAIGIVDEINDKNPPDYRSPDASINAKNTVDGIKLVALSAKYLFLTKTMQQQVVQKQCKPAYDCFQTLGEKLLQDVFDITLDTDAINAALASYLGAVSENLTEEQQANLTQHLQHVVDSKQMFRNSLELSTFDKGSLELSSFQKGPINPDNNLPENNKQHSRSSGLISWFDNLVQALGLGFGWAAFYFSILTASWKGQTPGKKLLGLKVIKLDNTPLNLWGSFGRYGGYAAGFATGLMGFLQVFWDPNRQAIHDKISDTLVIDLRKPNVPFVKKWQNRPNGE